MRELLVVVLVLACPLMMVFVMRGGHGHGHTSREPQSTAELRRQRDELGRLIEEREVDEEEPTPTGAGQR